MKRHIRLRGINGEVEGQIWEGDTILRAGRLGSLEICLDDSSVSRRHAEIKHTLGGWRLRDLGSTNGTYLNGERLSAAEHPLKQHDIIRCGNLTLVVEALQDSRDEEDVPEAPNNMQVEVFASSSLEDAIKSLVFNDNSGLRPGQQLEALLRAGHHLGHLESEEDLLHAILNDAVGTLDAQRGAIALADGPGGTLRL
ncbi:MAG TPA: FHA domain-containing protein, partial [Gemmataceae bacterium]|nr:FHA domain-containing protein [Gemmataceae bacterium]